VPLKDKAAYNEYHRKYYKERRTTERRAYNLKKRYGLEADDYEMMMTAQGSVCALCFRNPHKKRPLHVDHDHGTGQVRGLLCASCNTTLGKIAAMPGGMTGISHYLMRSQPLAVDS
jgi:hypothetical protein